MTITPVFALLLVLNGQAEARADPYEAALAAAIHQFARDGRADHLKAILDKHPGLVDALEPPTTSKPDATGGYTPLDWAASRGRLEVAAELIRHGARVNAADPYGWTSLHLAARDGHLDVVKLLVEHGASLRARTEAIPESRSDSLPGSPPGDAKAAEPPRVFPAIPSRTALDWAIAMKHHEVADYLKLKTNSSRLGGR